MAGMFLGRMEFSQGGRLTVGNDILAISTPEYARQIAEKAQASTFSFLKVSLKRLMVWYNPIASENCSRKSRFKMS